MATPPRARAARVSLAPVTQLSQTLEPPFFGSLWQRTRAAIHARQKMVITMTVSTTGKVIVAVGTSHCAAGIGVPPIASYQNLNSVFGGTWDARLTRVLLAGWSGRQPDRTGYHVRDLGVTPSAESLANRRFWEVDLGVGKSSDLISKHHRDAHSESLCFGTRIHLRLYPAYRGSIERHRAA